MTNIDRISVYEKVLGALKIGLNGMSVFSTGYDSEPGTIGKTVYVPVIGSQTAATGGLAVADYESGDQSTVSVALSLSENIYRSNHLTAVEASLKATDCLEKALVEAAYAVANHAQLKAFDLITTAYTNASSAIAASALDGDALLDLKAACVNLGYRKFNCVLDTLYYTNLLKDPAVRDASASGVMAGQTGEVTKWAGMDIHSSALVTTSTGVAALEGFICEPSAMGLAIRPPSEIAASGFDMIQNVSDPETGITFQVREWSTPKSNTKWNTVEVLWGGARVDVARLYRIMSA